jgi:hypothetical protein
LVNDRVVLRRDLEADVVAASSQSPGGAAPYSEKPPVGPVNPANQFPAANRIVKLPPDCSLLAAPKITLPRWMVDLTGCGNNHRHHSYSHV